MIVSQVFENGNVYEHQQKQVCKLLNRNPNQPDSQSKIVIVQDYRQGIQYYFNQKKRDYNNKIRNVEFG